MLGTYKQIQDPLFARVTNKSFTNHTIFPFIQYNKSFHLEREDFR